MRLLPQFIAIVRDDLPFGIGRMPGLEPSLYGLVRDGIHIDAIALVYDSGAFLRRFLARWPMGSAAYASYFERITTGADHAIARAAPASVVADP